MARLLLLAIAVMATASTATAWFNAGTVQNEFIVKYNILPDPFHQSNFINMPRTTYDAITQGNSFGHSYDRPQDNTVVYCRWTDYRVCLLFDKKDSIAGIRLSVKQSDMERSGFDLSDVPEWELNWNQDARENVYSATVFFVSKEDLLAGGRRLAYDGLTAPDGIWILQTDKNGTEINRLHVPNEQSQATSAGFTEQSCFFGMGKHYFQELHKDGTCENHRPYFMLYGPQSKTLNGFGFVQYGKVTSDSRTEGRDWFESPPAKVAKMIAPNSPACLEDWVNKKGLFTMHVYFVSSPYYTRC